MKLLSFLMTVSTWEVCIPSREQTWRVQALRVAELLWRIGSRSDEFFVSYSFPVSCLESWCVSFTWRQNDWIWCNGIVCKVTEFLWISRGFAKFWKTIFPGDKCRLEHSHVLEATPLKEWEQTRHRCLSRKLEVSQLELPLRYWGPRGLH